MSCILIADDNQDIIITLELLLTSQGHEVIAASTPAELMQQLTRSTPDLILMDLNYQLDSTSGQEGLTLLQQIRTSHQNIPVIVMTGWATIELAIATLKGGANDFIQKPWQNDQLLHCINTQLSLQASQQLSQRLTKENQQLRKQLNEQPVQLVAESAAMQQLLSQIQRLERSDSSILLLGENGTGKSLLASYIHQHSKRAGHPFVSVNMGAIAEGLFESELFGHVKGAFTGANAKRTGRFERAEHGTLFLDEIGNIPGNQQAKLLSVLEDKRYEMVGSSSSKQADVRLISATNADLKALIKEGDFRQDLFFRLNTITLIVPPLRERKDDIIPLAQSILQKLAQQNGLHCPVLTDDAIQALLQYAWPGNVRELHHACERALFLNHNDQIDADLLALAPADSAPLSTSTDGNAEGESEGNATGNATESTANETPIMPLTLSLDDIEKQAIEQRLHHFNGSVQKTAASLGLSRSAWYRRIEKHNL